MSPRWRPRTPGTGGHRPPTTPTPGERGTPPHTGPGRPNHPPTTPTQRERGTGLITSAVSVLVVIVVLTTTAQVAFHLQATSAVGAAAAEAARAVAIGEATCTDVPALVRRRLGAYSETAGARIECRAGPAAVTVRVRTSHPSLVPAGFRDALPLMSVDRTARAHREGWVP